MSTSTTAYIAAGSNLGDRRAAIDSAIAAFRSTVGITVKAVSSIIETAPVGLPLQGQYLNAVIELEASLDSRSLLETCLRVEVRHGRNRSVEQRWGPRTLDLDVLLYGEAVVDEPGLTVPHPRLHERLFVLEPLAELAPHVVHPVLGRSIADLRDELRARSGQDRRGLGPVLAAPAMGGDQAAGR
jgi:2-amino-4-hydroxy-6-hydroxymethyldihydropteridine diphosphokinase